MNDRFKFRSWDCELKKYVYKNIFSSHWAYDDTDNPENYYFDDELTLEQPEQCTGLKDTNGKLIYFNDFVDINNVVYKVIWNDTKISLVNMLNNDIIDFNFKYILEVIGNEHENENINKISQNPERDINKHFSSSKS